MVVEIEVLFICRGGRLQSRRTPAAASRSAGAVSLTDIVRPAAAALADAAAKYQQINHPAVVHIHVVQWFTPAPRIIIERPWVLCAVIGKLAGDLFDMLTRYAGDAPPARGRL